MLSRGLYAAAALLLGTAVGVAQTAGNGDVIAVGQPRGAQTPVPSLPAPPPTPSRAALPPLEQPVIKPVVYQPPPVAPPIQETRSNPQANMTSPSPSSSSSALGSVLFLEAVGPASIAPEQPLAYEIIVRNAGSYTLGRVRVEDVLPAGAKLRSAEPEAEVQNDRLAWNMGNLDPGVERRIKVEIQPGTVQEVTLTPTATFVLTKPCRTRIVRPPFAVTQTVSETASRGGPVAFQIHVANNSEQAISNIVLHDDLPPGLVSAHGDKIICDIPRLEPGETKTIKLDAVAMQCGRLTNRISANAPGGWLAEAQTSVLVTEAPLAVRLDAPKQAMTNQDVNCQIEVSNPGHLTAGQVRIRLPLPDGVDFVTASTNGSVDATGRSVQWLLGALPAGQTQTLTLKVHGKAPGDWILKTTASADGTPDATAAQSVHLEGTPTLLLEVLSHNEAIDLGAESVYEVRLLNHGTAPMTGLRLQAAATPGLLVLNAEGPTAFQVQPQQVTFEALPQLPGRSDATYRIRVKGQTAGNGSLTVQAAADSLSKPLVQQISTRVVAR